MKLLHCRKNYPVLFLFVILIVPFFQGCLGSENELTISSVKESVNQYNYNAKQDSSIIILNEFLKKKDLDTSDIILAHIALSNTYKSVLNYDKAKFYLDELDPYLTTNKGELYVNVCFEKALIEFDTNNYDESLTFLNLLQDDIHYLDNVSRAQYIMLLGYIHYKLKDNKKAIDYLQVSIDSMKRYAPRHLPMIFPKMMEVYGVQKELNKIFEMRDSSLYYARKYDIKNYALYTCEVFLSTLESNGFYDELEDAKKLCAEELDSKMYYIEQNEKIADSMIKINTDLLNRERKIKLIVELLLGLLGIVVLVLLTLVFLYKKQNKELDRLNKNQNEILGIIGHDIRKPSVVFQGIARKVNYLIKKGDFQRINELGESLDRNAKALEHLTDNLLRWSLSNQERYILDIQCFPIKENVEIAISMLYELAEVKGIDLNVDIDSSAKIMVDQNSFFIMVRNIVDNGIKFTSKGGRIDIWIEEFQQKTKIHIADNGVGLSEAKLKQLRSAKIVNTQGTEGEKGTGLGLLLVKKLVTLNYGSLQINSTLNSGTIFTIELPGKN